MVLIPPTSRPGEARSLGNHEARIRALERALGRGWKFDFNNQGGWGYLQFNDSFDLDLLPDPLAVGGTWGAAFEDATGDGFLIGSDGGPVMLKARGADLSPQPVILQSTDGTNVAQLTVEAVISSFSGSDLWFYDPDGDITAQIGGASNDDWAHQFLVKGAGGFALTSFDYGTIFSYNGVSREVDLNFGGDFDIGFQVAATKIQVRDSGGNPLFEIREGGTFHIKTGATWIADL